MEIPTRTPAICLPHRKILPLSKIISISIKENYSIFSLILEIPSARNEKIPNSKTLCQKFSFCRQFRLPHLSHFVYPFQPQFLIIPCILMAAKGRYIHIRVNRCHNPSFSIQVFLNSSLSAIINRTKNISANPKETADKIAISFSSRKKDKIERNSGTKMSAIKPREAPMPCTFDAKVCSAFVSFTENSPDKIPAPIANRAIKMSTTSVSPADCVQ